MNTTVFDDRDAVLKLLVIDDNLDFAENLAEILSDGSAEVVVTHDLKSALEEIDARCPDVAFVDLRLPDGDGRQIIRHLDEISPDSLSIVLTGDASLQSAVTCINSGAFGFLLKDMPVDAILASFSRARERILLLRQKDELEARLRDQERLALIGQMAATLAHEIRNPLTGISQALSVLLEAVGEPPTLEGIADSIRNRFRNLFDLVEELLEFSRPLAVERRDHDVAELIDSVTAEMLGEGSLAVDVDLVIQIEDASRTASIDPLHFRSLLRNLVRNASQALEGHEVREISIKVGRAPKDTVLIVEDSGPGLDEPERVFEPFYTTRTRGTGLGLALVQRIVEAHGGRVEARNTPGARFTVTIPDLPGKRP